jgi:catechol 2,3-dioxygenase-like lactoylglutathione lyase family enzyme
MSGRRGLRYKGGVPLQEDRPMNAPERSTAPPPSPLADAPMTTILPVRDLERARRFYADALGLAPVGARPDGKFLFRAGGGALLALFPKAEGTKAEHTAASFEVGDIAASIRALKARGVAFHDYDLPGFRTVEHVCVLGSEKAAWFSDPDGNILCIHEEVGG